MGNRRVIVLAMAAGALLVSACEQPGSATRDAVVAKVGRSVISEAEVAGAVSRLGPLDATESAQARGKVLEALVDQYLVSAAARDDGLDKLQEVALALQQAQRQVLVEAYMERLFKNLPPPTEAEIRDYYVRHPELFGERKLYRVQELEFQLPPERVTEVEAQLKQARSLADFAAWLEAQGISSRSGGVVRAAEQIPAPLLARLAAMQPGQMTMMPSGSGRASVLQLQGSQPQPVTPEQARTTIERVLLGNKRKTLMEAELGKLRARTKVEYASGFTPAAPVHPDAPGSP